MSTDPVAHKTIDLYARVDGKEYPIAQGKAPVYAAFDPKATDLRKSVTFSVGDPVVEGLSGFGEQATKARALLEQWKRKVEDELNAVEMAPAKPVTPTTPAPATPGPTTPTAP